MTANIPAEWGKGLKIRARKGYGFQVDDIDNNFSVYPAGDMTALFREPEIHALESLAKYLAQSAGHKKLLSLPSSVGCEGYSLAAIFNTHAVPGASLSLELCDISEKKLRAAETGIYPSDFAKTIPKAYKAHFQNDDKLLKVRSGLKEMVSTLPATDVLDMTMPEESYDAITSLNLFYYLKTRENKVKAAQKLAQATDNMLCISHGIRRSFEEDGDAVRQAILAEGFHEDTKFYTRYDAYIAQVFVKEP